MSVSFHKYGRVADAVPWKIDALESAKARVAQYKETGNTEWLIDAANFIMMEFMHPSHANAHFRATDSKEAIGRVSLTGDGVTKKSNEELGE